jgi:hypothetical protein
MGAGIVIAVRLPGPACRLGHMLRPGDPGRINMVADLLRHVFSIRLVNKHADLQPFCADATLAMLASKESTTLIQ